MTVFTEGRHPVAFILSEAAGYRSREAIKIPASQTIVPGQVLGARAVVADTTATVVVPAGNTGNGVLTLANPAVSAKAKNGRYTVEIITAASNAGTFRVEGPDGKEIGTGTVAVAFNKEIKFTLADATDFAVGDKIYVDIGVEPADFEFLPYDKAAVDGLEVVAAIACYGCVTGVGETERITGFVRDGEVNAKELVLPDGLSAAESAKVYADLALKGVIVRN